ncbi:5195_t:CDS:2 [Dentiscutata erythropus]|uniref:5195_t:CDS:1 n=1 Tax=Dentiscutata erythropus TaxID=1348616 RepID=A0A9N9B0C9_9GLOM|nr:5195_t:CDS:2 [Dentiscutata erythropus]
MSVSTSQNEDFVVEVFEPGDKEDKNNSEGEENEPKKYFAISPEGDFLVELVVKNFEFELQMYNINNSNNADDSTLENNSEQKDDLKPESDPEIGDGQGLSYKKLSSIHTTFKFTDKQLNLIKDEYENIFRWSVAVSDKSTGSSEFRLIAMSCINLKDMRYYEENFNKIHPSEIPNHGFTFELPIKYGGIVKLFSKKDSLDNKKAEEDKQRTDKISQNADGYTLILFTLSGIYKYQIKNKLIKNIQKLRYPRRVYNAMIHNMTFFLDLPENPERNAYDMVCEYMIKKCINQHYFLVDTMSEDIKYIEIYDLNTNQLVNTFQRQNLPGPLNFDMSSLYAISNNGKLLAYVSLLNNGVKIYSIECGLEIAEIITDIPDSELEFVDFFHNDEMLLILSKSKWFVWDIFGSLRDSVKLENLGFIIELPLDFDTKIEQSNSFMVVDNGDELVIYDDMIIDKYLKSLKKDEQNWKTLSSDYFSRQDLDNNNILDLQGKESKLEDYYQILEPWLIKYDRRHPRYSFYLDDKKEKLLLIGNHTIQVWHDQGPGKRYLEFIYVPQSLNYEKKFMEAIYSELKFIKIIDINYCNGKFKLSIQIEDETSENQVENTFQVKIENRNDIMITVKYACYSLKYLFVYKKFELFFSELKLEYRNIVEQTRKIILRFIRMYPNEWKLLDIRYDLMSVLIEAREYKLINDILSSGEPLHIPQYFSWSGGISTICTALSDRTILACFLEYYSNNAVNNIGWMNTIIDIIPELYNKENNEKENVESYTYYAQKLFYKPCFCNKKLDLVSFKFLEISPKSSDLLKVLVPITQLIPQDSELDLQEIDYGKIVNIRMVPLTDFATNKKVSDIGERKSTNFLKNLISPSQYSSLKEEDYSPFIKIIMKEPCVFLSYTF